MISNGPASCFRLFQSGWRSIVTASISSGVLSAMKTCRKPSALQDFASSDSPVSAVLPDDMRAQNRGPAGPDCDHAPSFAHVRARLPPAGEVEFASQLVPVPSVILAEHSSRQPLSALPAAESLAGATSSRTSGRHPWWRPDCSPHRTTSPGGRKSDDNTSVGLKYLVAKSALAGTRDANEHHELQSSGNGDFHFENTAI